MVVKTIIKKSRIIEEYVGHPLFLFVIYVFGFKKLSFCTDGKPVKNLIVPQDLSLQKTEQEIVVVQPLTPGRSSDQDAGVDKDYGLYQASDESSGEEQALMSYKADSISTIVLENAKLIIDRLYKLSFKIRNPATRLGFFRARSYCAKDGETGVDLMKRYAYFDLRHVAETMARYCLCRLKNARTVTWCCALQGWIPIKDGDLVNGGDTG